jgi:hypothetical protein
MTYKYDFRAGGVVQVMECLPSKFEALSSNPNTTSNNKKSVISFFWGFFFFFWSPVFL